MASSRHNGKKNMGGPSAAASSASAAQDEAGESLTTAQGLRLPDTDHSLKAGQRGPTLLEDFHLREKITHFDHERIPERVVHARGAAAHGVFESYGTGRSVTKAGFLARKGLSTEVFVRFSTVLGSRGSADTVRDTRGFAVKFYTAEGNFDLVGNNMPVFFIQDGIKFPDIIHAAKPHPVSFGDHFTQPAMFYRSLTPLEQAHIVEAFTFELGKCYEQAISERELQVLANVDADLCAQVAAGLGLPATGGRPAADAAVSPALSQIVTEPGPIAGRMIGIVADAGADLAGIGKIRTAAAKLGATALVIAPAGGVLGSGTHAETVDRTLLTTRSVEFDALVVAGGTAPAGDIKLTLLLQEAFRHCKILAAWGDGTKVLEAAGITADAAGVVTGQTAVKSFTDQLAAAIGLHRAWDRAAAVMASAVPPVLTS